MQFRFQNGEVQVNHNRFMGYTKDEDGHLIIEPAEAEIVKRIYRKYLQGASLKQIGDGLMEDGILTAAGKAKWRPESVKKILRNEKYIGDALLQKTYTVDVLTKKRVKITVSFRSTMWRIATNRLFPAIFICRCRKRCSDEPIFTAAQSERNGFTAVNMHFPGLCIVQNAVTFTAGLLGTTVGSIPRYGDA